MRKPAPYGGKAHKRTVRDTREERDLCYGRLIDYNHDRKVEMFWDLNNEAKQDVIFRLRIGGRSEQPTIDLLLDGEEVMKYLRWV